MGMFFESWSRKFNENRRNFKKTRLSENFERRNFVVFSKIITQNSRENFARTLDKMKKKYFENYDSATTITQSKPNRTSVGRVRCKHSNTPFNFNKRLLESSKIIM